MMKQNKSNIFISGSTGFIGNHLKKYLRKKNYSIIKTKKKTLNLKKYLLKIS